MAAQTAAAPMRVTNDQNRRVVLVLLGGLCGLAWAAGLRGFMAQIVQEDSNVSWSGTFGYILLPGLLIGLLLGWAEHLRRSGGRHGWRWLALSPLLFAAILFSEGPMGVLGIFEDGLGEGAIGVPLYAMAGGYALAGRGPPLGPTRLRRTGTDSHSHLGTDRRVLRRNGPGRHHTPRAVGRSLLLLVPRAVYGRCRCPAPARSRQLADERAPGARIRAQPTGSVVSMNASGRAKTHDGRHGPSPIGTLLTGGFRPRADHNADPARRGSRHALGLVTEHTPGRDPSYTPRQPPWSVTDFASEGASASSRPSRGLPTNVEPPTS